MKNIVVVLMLVFGVATMNAQAFNGKGDTKFQVGASFQENGSGIVASYDKGLG